MRRTRLTVYAILLLIFFGLCTQSAPYHVQAQASTYLFASPIPSTLHTTQVWMREPFCLRTWWYDEHNQLVRMCSEDKGSDTPSPGASHKVDLPGPAALALIGKAERWELSAVALAKPDSQLPGDNFVRVIGPTLVTILSPVTPSPVVPPPASVTSSPPFEVTATPTARVTPTPPSPPGGASPTPTPTLSLPGAIPGPFSGQLSVNGMCSVGVEIAYIYNIKRDSTNKIISFDKIICTTRSELRKIQNFDAIATLDARVPITTAWWILSTPTPVGSER